MDGNSKSPNGVRIVEIGPDRDGQRLDNLLCAMLKGVPKSWVYRVIRKGQVRVNGSRCKAAQRVKAGDKVRIPPVRMTDKPGQSVPQTVMEDLASRIVHEDADVLVIDKPSGLAVHAGSGLGWGVIDALRQHRQEPGLELAHRLDRETSGCLIMARHRLSLLSLQNQWRDGQVTKRYLCLVLGRLPDRLVADQPLRRNVLKGGERVVQVDLESGRSAHTEFRRLQGRADWSFAQAEIETGRTHQIRVHAQYAGHPLAGDPRYGQTAFNQAMRELGLRRLFLHCSELAFDALDGQRMVVHAPLDNDLRGVLDRLEAGSA